jgi:hypothetical protein
MVHLPYFLPPKVLESRSRRNVSVAQTLSCQGLWLCLWDKSKMYKFVMSEGVGGV